MKLIVALPYCSTDHQNAKRLLEWIAELDQHASHHLLLVADTAVPMEIKREMDALGKILFDGCETIMPKCPTPVKGNYHPATAVMFERTAAHIDACYKRPWLWMEPDCVPLTPRWLDMLAEAYHNCPKRFMGSMQKTDGKDGLPGVAFFATAIYPHCAHEELKQFCDGNKAFDMAFSDFVVPRGQNSSLFHHCFGSPTDAPTFKDVKLPADGPNVGALESLNKEAVLFHRNKDGSLIDLLRKARTPEPQEETPKRQGFFAPRKPKQETAPQQT